MSKIIIDANVAHEFGKQTPEALAVISWLKSRGTVATGGLNLVELQKTKVGPLIRALKAAGRAVQFDAVEIRKLAETYQAPLICSDDPHVIALAIVSHARILFSRDQPLQQDFCNPNVVNNPRGKCFTHSERHKHLLYCR